MKYVAVVGGVMVLITGAAVLCAIGLMAVQIIICGAFWSCGNDIKGALDDLTVLVLGVGLFSFVVFLGLGAIWFMFKGEHTEDKA